MGTLEIIVGLLTAACTAGGILYLVVEKLFDRSNDKAQVKHQEVENKKDTVEYGISMVTIYNEIDKIVEGKTRPIQDKLDKALIKIDLLEENSCFRKDCGIRISKRRMEELNDEARRAVCKD